MARYSEEKKGRFVRAAVSQIRFIENEHPERDLTEIWSDIISFILFKDCHCSNRMAKEIATEAFRECGYIVTHKKKGRA